MKTAAHKYYKYWWMTIGVPATVVAATVIGTPHTLGDPILYLKIGLNLITGGGIWLFYFLVVSWFDRKLPWESVSHLKRWALQLAVSIPPVALFMWGMVLVRNSLIGSPFSPHIFIYTDLPVLCMISFGIQFIYYQAYVSAKRKELQQPKTTASATSKPGGAIVVRKVKKTFIIPFQDVAYFYRNSDFNFLRKWDGEELIVDESLNALEEQVDATHFFRINRQLLANRQAIISFQVLESRHAALELKPSLSTSTTINKNRFNEFKRWLHQE